MVKVGDNHWYGKSVPQNITFAAEMYAEAASKNDLPQVTLLNSRKNIRIFRIFNQSEISIDQGLERALTSIWYVVTSG